MADFTPSMCKAARMEKDVGEHGEVHATFEGREREVEVRLGTAKFNFDAATIEIWDGDHYRPFSMNHLVDWYKPLDVFHT